VSRVIRLARIVAATVLVAAVVVGCSASGSGITVTGAWVRVAAATAASSVAYMTIQNGGSTADALIGVSTPAAGSAQVHETVAMDGTPPSAPGGMIGMQPVDRLEIPAGASVELKPGGYHIMLMELTADLRAGDRIDLTLTFEKAGEVKVTAEVRAS
jgi:periplasmic copper chaperone A